MNPENDGNAAGSVFPWWGYVILAICTYLGLTYGFPLLCNRMGYQSLAGLGGEIAPILTIVFLLLGANGLYRDVDSDKDTVSHNPDNKEEKSG